MNKRECGSCQLCCVLLPVEELEKPALKRCQHQKHGKGCAIYGRHPLSCQVWSCRWLVDDEHGDLARPDRSHFVVDILPDIIRMTQPPAASREEQVIVVWLDPAYPDAHRDEGLRRYIERFGRPALIRTGSDDSMMLFPPSYVGDGQWHERGGQRADPSFKGLPQRMREAARASQAEEVARAGARRGGSAPNPAAAARAAGRPSVPWEGPTGVHTVGEHVVPRETT
jgi:hypothetical protein